LALYLATSDSDDEAPPAKTIDTPAAPPAVTPAAPQTAESEDEGEEEEDEDDEEDEQPPAPLGMCHSLYLDKYCISLGFTHF
jgi:hypothetical protein